jgi:CheY-like chemotaxis protein
MTRVLLVDDDRDHTERIGRELSLRGLTVIYAADAEEATKKLRENASVCDLVILCVADRARPWLSFLKAMQEACWQVGFLEFPLFLCVSRIELGHEFQLRVERMGARFVCEE